MSRRPGARTPGIEPPASRPGADAFRSAGRALFSLGLVSGTEGNLSTFDGATIVITRTGAELNALGRAQLVSGALEAELDGASSDLAVHRSLYRERGSGAVVHAHPPGTVPEGRAVPGAHGLYVFAATLEHAVDEAVRRVREGTVGHGRPILDDVWSRSPVHPVEWVDGVLRILDQRRLPRSQRYLRARTAEDVADAIRVMAVRGAPLLGIAAAYGMALAARRSTARGPAGVLRDLTRAGQTLSASRPTAVNISWAVDRVARVAEAEVRSGLPRGLTGLEVLRRRVEEEAHRILEEDRASCEAIGRLGAMLIPDRANILTHCNTGALATGGWGTAQGMILAAHRSGKRVHVWVDETRPVLQGARLTAWELQRCGIPLTLVPDTAAATLMAGGLVDVVVVGADRIAANGDVANKLGTYQLAVLAAHHGIPFYVAAPFSTVDPATPTGDEVTIEERDPREVTEPAGVRVAPEGTAVVNPAFDVTPAALVTAVITDRGLVRAPIGSGLEHLAERSADVPNGRGGGSVESA